MKRVFVLLIIGILFQTVAFAQSEPRFSVEISNDSILLGNYFIVKFTLENASSSNFQAPDFSDFHVVSGPNFSSSMTVINGNMSQKASYTFYLEPKDIGNYFIQPASIETEAGTLETVPLEILVVPNPEGITQKPEMEEETMRFDMRMDDFFNRPAPEEKDAKPKRKTRKTVKT